MENIISAKQELKEIEKRIESRRVEILEEIEACEAEKEKSRKKAEECLNKGDVEGRVKNLDLFFFNKARIERLNEELEEPENENKAEIKEIIKTVKAETKKQIKETEDIYFEFWQKAKEAEKKANKAIVESKNIITRCGRITKTETNNILSNPFQNMFESTRHNLRFFEAWQRLDKRK